MKKKHLLFRIEELEEKISELEIKSFYSENKDSIDEEDWLEESKEENYLVLFNDSEEDITIGNKIISKKSCYVIDENPCFVGNVENIDFNKLTYSPC